MFLKKRLPRIAAIVIASGFVLLLIIWAVAGPIAKPQLVKLLKSQGAESASIQSIVFNPFRPSLQIKEMIINADSGRPLYLERAYMRLSWTGLLRKEIYIKQIEIQSFNLKVDQTTEDTVIGGLKPAQKKSDLSEPADSDKTENKPLEWVVRLDELLISSSLLEILIPEFTGAFTLDKVQLKNWLIGEQIFSGELDLKGNFNNALTSLNTRVDINKGKGSVTSKLDVDKLALAMFQPFLDNAVSGLKGDVSLQTSSKIQIDGQSLTLDQDADIKMADLKMQTPDMALAQKQGELHFDLSAQANELKPEKIHLKRLVLNDTHLAFTLKKKKPKPETKAPDKESGKASDKNVAKSPENMVNGEKQPGIGIKVDSLEVTGNTRIDFSDQNLDPIFKEQIRKLNFKITDMDNQQLEKACPFSLSAEIQKYGKLNFSGILKPFSKELYADINGKISEYGLPPTSGYTNTMLGYNIKTGQLNADVNLKIENRVLDGETKFDFKALKLIPAAKETSEQLTKQATMPLDLALGYISDDKGNLQLDIPIEGSLDDPQFGISHLCQIVMVKAAKSAAYSYLKKMILPYGALVQIGADLVISAGKEMMSLKLEPLVYQPGQIKPGPESKAYIDQLVTLMTKEPQMRLIICGIAVNADLVPPATDKTGQKKPIKKLSETEKEKKLLELATKRMDLFKKMLIKTHGIKSSRLLDCYPRVDTEPDSRPRIEIDL